MRVEVKEVATPMAATAAKLAGASPKRAAPTGKRSTASVLWQGMVCVWEGGGGEMRELSGGAERMLKH